MQYIVLVKEIHIQQVLVDAKDKEEAIEKVVDGDGDYLSGTDSLETLDTEEWSVKEA
jgi:hypothetical protein|tara:strand:- start:189 stop:359 length:171 start_codon:yes stop_codon:yes gene_type:complete